MGLKSKKSTIHANNADEVNSSGVNGGAIDTGSQDRDADFSKLHGDGEPMDIDSGNTEAADGEEVLKLKQELADTRDKYLRALADFENFKKRTQKERSELLRYQGESILVDILDVVDGLERALEHTTAESEKLTEGLKLVYKQFVDTLAKWEVKADSALGKEFDPNRHRAIGKAKGEKAGIVLGELKKPYFYRDKLLRVGEVVVSEVAEEEPQTPNVSSS